MKTVAGTLKLSLAQYREQAAFAQFGSDLDTATQEQLANGDRQVEILKQGQYTPMPVEEQVVSIYAAMPQRGRRSWIRNLALDDIPRYEHELLAYMRSQHADILETIRSTGKLEPEVAARLTAALDSFAGSFRPSRTGEAAA
jgi:F-type H+-transporting ATPase subunit alpha